MTPTPPRFISIRAYLKRNVEDKDQAYAGLRPFHNTIRGVTTAQRITVSNKTAL